MRADEEIVPRLPRPIGQGQAVAGRQKRLYSQQLNVGGLHPESCSASQFLAIKRCNNMIQMNEFYSVREQWHRVREIWDTCLERALHRLHCSHVPTTHMIFTGIVRCSSCNTLLRKKSPFHNSIILLVDVICFHPSINTFLVLFPFTECIVVFLIFTQDQYGSFLCLS